MTFTVRVLVSATLLSFALPALCTTPRRKTTATHTTAHPVTHHATTHTTKRGIHTSRVSSKSHKSRPVLTHVEMTPERATQIQTALIRQGYLTGEPTGKWDAASIAAMQKLQSDNGWQTKIMPDSRAIIKLGLGPNNPGQ